MIYLMLMQQLLDYDKRTLLDKRAIGQTYTNKLLSEAMGQCNSSSTPPIPPKQVPKPHNGENSEEEDVEISEEEDEEMSEKEDMEIPEEEDEAMPQKEDMEIPENGDVVAGVLPGSTMEHPLVIIGKVFRVNHERQEVQVSQLRHMRGTKKYIYEVFGATQRISYTQMVHPIDVHYHKEGNYYELRTSVFDIHYKHSHNNN